MDELVYFSNRSVGEGKAKVWVFKGDCPKCKGLMGKPKDDTGKVKIRAKEYACEKCGHTEEKMEHEATLTACAAYTCPSCKKEGEGETPYKRKSFKGVKALVFECSHCKAKIPVTKKMKDLKE